MNTYIYTSKGKSVEMIPPHNGDAKIVAALGLTEGDSVVCDYAGWRTEYIVQRNRYRRERTLVLAAKNKYQI